MWNNYRMHYWKIYDDCIITEGHRRYEAIRKFFIAPVKVYDGNGESKVLWTFRESWWATNGKLIQIFQKTCYDSQFLSKYLSLTVVAKRIRL